MGLLNLKRKYYRYRLSDTNRYRRLRNSCLQLISVLVIAVNSLTAILPAYLLTQTAKADSPYLASDVLGQDDFESNHEDGMIAQLSANGLAGAQDTALDIINHRLFVNDTSNNRILIYNLDTNNNLVDTTADNVLGQADFTGGDCNQGGSLTASSVCVPQGLAYDSANNRLFVSDTSNSRVLIFDVAAITNGEAAVNVLGQSNFITDTGCGVPTASKFCNPSSLTHDTSNNRLFVADVNFNRVLIFDVAAITNGEAAVNVLGQANFTSFGADVNAQGFQGPSGLAYDAGNNRLFVADTDNNRLLVFDTTAITNNEDAVNVLGQEDFTTTNCICDINAEGFWRPKGLTYDTANNRLFVADSETHRVLVFDVAAITNNEPAVNVLGQADFTSSTNDTNAQGFNGPSGLTYDTANNRLFVADSGNHRVLIFDVTSTTNNESAVSVVGQDSLTTGFPQNIAKPNNHGLDEPLEVAIDTVHHRLFVAEEDNNRVTVFNLDSNNNLVDKTADYVLGQSDFNGQNSARSASRMDEPEGLTYDHVHDRLFVGEEDNNRILVFDTATITNGEDAVGVLGQEDFTSFDSAIAANRLGDQYGDSAYDHINDRLYVMDRGRYRVLVFDTATITNGEDAVGVLGQEDFTTVEPHCSTDTGATIDGFCSPESLAFDVASNQLFVPDRGNNRVLIFDLSSGITSGMDAAYVLGQDDFISGSENPGGRDASTFDGPDDVEYDPNNKHLYVVDANNQRVLVFDATTFTNGEDATFVLGQADFTTADSGTSQSSFQGPRGVDLDLGNDRLYLADENNHRTLIFDLAHITTSSLPNTSPGSLYNQTINVDNEQGALTFSVSSGSLPTGLVLNPLTGSITGTPTTNGTYNFTIKATDDNGDVGSIFDTQSYVLSVSTTPSGGSGSSSSSSSSSSSTTRRSTTTSTTEETTTEEETTTPEEEADTPITKLISPTKLTKQQTKDPDNGLNLWLIGGSLAGLALLIFLIKLFSGGGSGGLDTTGFNNPTPPTTPPPNPNISPTTVYAPTTNTYNHPAQPQQTQVVQPSTHGWIQ